MLCVPAENSDDIYKKIKGMMKSIRIGDGVSLGLAFDQSKCFLGISDVEIGGAPMRSPRLPSFIEIRSPDGIELFDYRTTDILQESGGLDEFYSTEWYLPSCANPNIFQFQPFQTQFQGFTFTGCRDGILVTWASEVSHIRTLIEKPRAKDELVHMHEHCGDLSDTFETKPAGGASDSRDGQA
jgi:hypothetical protein